MIGENSGTKSAKMRPEKIEQTADLLNDSRSAGARAGLKKSCLSTDGPSTHESEYLKIVPVKAVRLTTANPTYIYRAEASAAPLPNTDSLHGEMSVPYRDGSILMSRRLLRKNVPVAGTSLDYNLTYPQVMTRG